MVFVARLHWYVFKLKFEITHPKPFEILMKDVWNDGYVLPGYCNLNVTFIRSRPIFSVNIQTARPITQQISLEIASPLKFFLHYVPISWQPAENPSFLPSIWSQVQKTFYDPTLNFEVSKPFISRDMSEVF